MSSPRKQQVASNVRVVCRVRPLNKKEGGKTGESCVDLTDEEIAVDSRDNGKQKFTFDRVFGPESQQRTVFDFVAKPLIQGNATCLDLRLHLFFFRFH